MKDVEGFSRLFFQYWHYRGLYTGDGFKIRVRLEKFGLTFKLYRGPYKDSKLDMLFIGFNWSEFLSRKVDRLIKNLSPEQKLRATKTLLEFELESLKNK